MEEAKLIGKRGVCHCSRVVVNKDLEGAFSALGCLLDLSSRARWIDSVDGKKVDWICGECSKFPLLWTTEPYASTSHSSCGLNLEV